MQCIHRCNYGVCFLFFIMDVYSKFTLLITLRDKKGETIAKGFQKIFDKTDCKPKKLRVDKGG